MRLFRIAALALLLTPSFRATATEIIARSHTWAGSVSLESEGSPASEQCSLDLIAKFQQASHRFPMKRSTDCALFGPVHLVLTETEDHQEVVIIVEAARGGDGDHTGPILEVFRVNKAALRKLGEVELFSATYIRRNQEIQFIEGRRLFSLCDVCDGPDAADPDDNFFIPVRVSFARNRLIIVPTASEAEQSAIWNRFQRRKSMVQTEYGDALHIESVEKTLRALLKRK